MKHSQFVKHRAKLYNLQDKNNGTNFDEIEDYDVHTLKYMNENVKKKTVLIYLKYIYIKYLCRKIHRTTIIGIHI